MTKRSEKVSSFDWVIFIIIGSAILATFMISQIKTSFIKRKVSSSFFQKSIFSEKKIKKPLS